MSRFPGTEAPRASATSSHKQSSDRLSASRGEPKQVIADHPAAVAYPSDHSRLYNLRNHPDQNFDPERQQSHGRDHYYGQEYDHNSAETSPMRRLSRDSSFDGQPSARNRAALNTNQASSVQNNTAKVAPPLTGPEAPPPVLAGLPLSDTAGKTFSLIIRQQPTQGRLCGLGSKDKRPLDPLPIIQLQIKKSDGSEDYDAHNSPNLMLHASIRRHEDVGEESIGIELLKSNDGSYPATRMLEGRVMASANVARDTDGTKACFFVFTDLSIRQEGQFRLRFQLIVLGRAPASSAAADAAGDVVEEAVTEPFTVYSPRHFPGMTESTELAKCLARQGIQVPIRNDVRKRAEQVGTGASTSTASAKLPKS